MVVKRLLGSPLSLAGNFIPVIGVLFLGWDLFGVLFSYSAQQVISAFFIFVQYVILRPDIQGMRPFFIMIGTLMFGALLFGLLMSFLDILSGSHGITAAQILPTLQSVTTTPLSHLAFSILYFIITGTYTFYVNLPRLHLQTYSWQLYGISLGHVITALILMAILGIAVTQGKLSLQLGVALLLILKILTDSFWSSSLGVSIMSI
jgi:hypothetical protein